MASRKLKLKNYLKRKEGEETKLQPGFCTTRKHTYCKGIISSQNCNETASVLRALANFRQTIYLENLQPICEATQHIHAKLSHICDKMFRRKYFAILQEICKVTLAIPLHICKGLARERLQFLCKSRFYTFEGFEVSLKPSILNMLLILKFYNLTFNFNTLLLQILHTNFRHLN